MLLQTHFMQGIGAAYVGTADTTAPAAPTNLVASGTTTTTTNLTWTAATDNVELSLQRLPRNNFKELQLERARPLQD
jgi:hypothetical protein